MRKPSWSSKHIRFIQQMHVESEDDDAALDYKDFMSSKSAVDNLTKLHDYFEDYNIDCKYDLNAIEKELYKSVLNSAIQKTITDFPPKA